MLTIKSKDWKKFINALAKINNAAAKEIEGLVGKGGLDNMDLISLMGQVYRVASVYGEATAALTCEMYDAIAVAQNAKVPPAEPARPITLQEVKDTVNYALSRSPQMIPAETGKLVKKMSTRTMRKNAARDGAKMALVPSGDGCAFCKMLGSRGWESARASKSFEAHLHSHCRCEYVVRFNGDLRVEGYDPDALYDEFMSLEGDTWEEKLNSMRRAQYAVNKDVINAQKREAYDARNTSENVDNKRERGIIRMKGEQTILISQLDKNEFAMLFHNDPSMFALYTPISLKRECETRGLEVQPLGRGRHKGQPFEAGGGYVIRHGGNKVIEYHPAKQSRHGGRYYRTSDPINGRRWFDSRGNEIDIKATGNGGRQVLK